MNRIRLKCDALTLAHKVDILKLFNHFEIKCSELVKNWRNNNEFIASCNSDEDTDKLFDVGCTDGLLGLGYTAIMPMKLQARRSIIVKKLDDLIYDHDAEEIKNELNRCNQSFNITNVIKFPNAKIIKITFINSEMAAKSSESGIKMFMLYISCSNIFRDEYVEVKTCFKCYELDSHIASECPKEEGYVICSKCAVVGHDFKSCQSSTKCCINCKMPHSTMSFACPHRKHVVKKTKETKVGNVNTYASVSRKSDPAPPIINHDQVHESVVKSMLCLIVSAEKEKEDPGCFSSVLRSLQITNNVPEFNLGDIEMPNSFVNFACSAATNNLYPESNDTPIVATQNNVPVTSATSAASESTATPSTSLNYNNNVSSVLSNGKRTYNEPLPSTSTTECDVESSVSAVSKPVISILKSKTCPTINSKNIGKLLQDGLLAFENDRDFTMDQCLQYFKNNLLECKSAITKAKVRDFRSVRNNTK